MAKNSPKAVEAEAEAQVEETEAQANPAFADLIAAAQEAKKAADEANALLAAKMKEANDAVSVAAAPLKERMLAEVITPRGKENERHANEMKKLSDKEAAIVEEAKAQGIDRVFLGITPSKPKGAKTGGSKGGKQNVRLSDLEGIENVLVTAPQRTGSHEPVGVFYTIFSEDGTDDAGNTVKVFKARGQREGKDTIREGNLTEAASLAGWHNVKDVAYALLTKVGKRGDYPDVEPTSDPSSILVDGTPVGDIVSQ